MNSKDKLVIIAGARRGIGKTFFDYYKSQKNVVAIGISRSDNEGFLNLNLYDADASLKAVRDINLGGINNIFYMHAVGIDKFEPDGNPDKPNKLGIDSDVYNSNVIAFKNFAKPFLDRVIKEKIPTTVCNIGSVSDVYEVPFWNSFTKSKNIVRKFMKSIGSDYVKGLMLNVSSTLDEDGRVYERINADTTYWQTSKELLEKSLPLVNLIHNLDSNFIEVDFYKKNPNFKSDYFTNLAELYKHWQKELGYVGKKILHGIRI